MIRLSDYVAKRLKEIHDVEHLFMLSGGGAMYLNDSFGKYIPYTVCHHEQACAIAAEGYARLNQKMAVVNVTTGPGGLNCLNGVFGQWTDSVPVLYISGQVKQSTMLSACPDIKLRQLGDQEVDIISCVKPLTKYAITVQNPNDIKYILDKAVYIATHGRYGACWIDIPINIQSALIDENSLKDYDPQEDELVLPDIEKEMSALKNLFEKCERPLIIAGHGIRLSNSKTEFLKLVGKFNIPVVTTMNGFDIIPSNNKNFIARIGTVANRAGNFVLQNADLVISIGSRNNIRQISYNWENFCKNAKLVLVDIDRAELDKPTLKPELKINTDAHIFIDEMIKNLNPKDFSKWNKWCHDTKKKFPALTEVQRCTPNPIEPYYFIKKLTEQFSKDEVVVCANGSAFLIPFQIGEVKENQRYIWNSGDASMGYGLPAAIGACIANNKKQTVCIEGDGSVMMNLQELQTIATYNLPIKLFILNNNGYISIKQTQDKFFDGRKSACTEENGVKFPDFTKICSAFGLKTFKIESQENIEEQIKKVLEYNNVAVCEVILSPDYVFAPKLCAKILPDGTMVSPDLSDLSPFLTKEEFEDAQYKN